MHVAMEREILSKFRIRLRSIFKDHTVRQNMESLRKKMSVIFK